MRLAIALSIIFAALGTGAARAGPPAELGTVDWERDFDAARVRAARESKPLFLLFQEVPGCETCVSFGQSVLSHPLLVEAIESEFVPVAVLNNRGGRDGALLERFGEPAWNNPVVRFVDADGDDLVPRRAGIWSRREIARRMVSALESAGRAVPPYVELLGREAELVRAEEATLAMHCFWTGEACLGDVPGILSTQPGWSSGREVVHVRFDPSRTDYRGLLRAAIARDCANHVVARDARQLEVARELFGDAVSLDRERPQLARGSDDKHYLSRSAYAELDLIPLQRTRVNTDLAAGNDPARWLSPRQLAQVRARANVRGSLP